MYPAAIPRMFERGGGAIVYTQPSAAFIGEAEPCHGQGWHSRFDAACRIPPARRAYRANGGAWLALTETI